MEWILPIVLVAVLGVAIAFGLALTRRPSDLKPVEIARRKLRLDTMKTFAEVMGGVLLLVALLFGWQELRSTQEQLETARQGQVTERFSRAVEQLGHPDASIRVGGVFALESIARDSPADHSAVFEVLASFLRENSPVEGSREDRDWTAWRSLRAPADVEAAAIAIGRRDIGHEPELSGRCDRRGGPNFRCALNLSRVDLSGINLSGMNLDRIDLSGAAFNFTDLGFTSMQGADIGFADLRGANLRLADVTDATLGFTYVEAANLHEVDGLTCEQVESTHDAGAGAANLTIDCT